MRITRGTRDLGGGLLTGARPTPPARAPEIIGALCAAYGRRRGGRKADFRFAPFPPDGDPAEIRTEVFGRYLGKLLKPYLPPPREERFPEAIERIKTSLGWGR